IGYSQKEKNEAKSDKTKHRIGKSVKKSRTSIVNTVNPQGITMLSSTQNRVFPTSPLQHTNKTSPSHTTPLHINPIPCWQSLEFLLGDDLKTKMKGCDELAWSGMDESKITRKHSKASKRGHENQKSSKPKPNP
ncbi:hypothetical protein Tco_0931272, partial [Tanacetum coccineum]